jgi:hypothetical protein
MVLQNICQRLTVQRLTVDQNVFYCVDLVLFISFSDSHKSIYSWNFDHQLNYFRLVYSKASLTLILK